MSKPPWCRLYSEVLSDRKIEYICRKTQQPKVVILGAWSIFLALANDSPERGVLLLTEDISYTMVDLVGEMGLDLETGSDIIGAFFELGLLTDDGNAFHVTNFDKRNFTSDNSAERVRAWRAKQGDEGEGEAPNDYEKSNGDVTPQGSYSNADVTPPETEAETQPEAKTDEEHAPSAAPPAPPPPPSNPETPLPKPPEETRDFDTPEARKLQARLTANHKAIDPKRRGPKWFGSLEQKRDFLAAVERLGARFDKALDAAMRAGCISTKRAVDYIASPKWQEDKHGRGSTAGARQDTPTTGTGLSETSRGLSDALRARAAKSG